MTVFQIEVHLEFMKDPALSSFQYRRTVVESEWGERLTGTWSRIAGGLPKIYSFNFLFVGFASHLFPLLKKSVALFVRSFVCTFVSAEFYSDGSGNLFTGGRRLIPPRGPMQRVLSVKDGQPPSQSTFGLRVRYVMLCYETVYVYRIAKIEGFESAKNSFLHIRLDIWTSLISQIVKYVRCITDSSPKCLYIKYLP